MGSVFRVYLIAVIFAIPQSGVASPARSSCLRQARQVLEKMDGNTLKVQSKFPGHHGGSRYLIQRKAWQSWSNMLSLEAAAPQGSPRWVFGYLDAQTAQFFGFKETPDGIVIPDQAELKGAIHAFNAIPKNAKSPTITMGVYSEPGLHASIERYLLRFVTDGELPWAMEGNYFHHDLNFHALAGVLIPTEFSHLGRRQLRAVFELRNYLAKEHSDLFREPLIQEHFKSLFSYLSTNLDISTGVLPQSLAQMRGPEISPRGAQGVNRILRYFCYEGLSPKKFIERLGGDINLMSRTQNNPSGRALAWKFRDAQKKFLTIKSHVDSEFDVGLPEASDPKWIHGKLLERLDAVNAEVKRYYELHPGELE